MQSLPGSAVRVASWRTILPNPSCRGPLGQHIRHTPPHTPGSPGASEAELDAVERQLGFALPPALRVLYRVHNGQELEFDRLVGAGAASTGWAALLLRSCSQGISGSRPVSARNLGMRLLVCSRPLRRREPGLASTSPHSDPCFPACALRQVDKQRTAAHESIFHGMFGGEHDERPLFGGRGL